jgi:hypothetical protein
LKLAEAVRVIAVSVRQTPHRLGCTGPCQSDVFLAPINRKGRLTSGLSPAPRFANIIND